MASWQAAVLELVDREHGEKLWAESLAQVVAAFNAPDLPVIRLVEVLGPHLTGEDDAQRSRATAVLAEVRVALCWPHLDPAGHAGDQPRWPGLPLGCKGCASAPPPLDRRRLPLDRLQVVEAAPNAAATESEVVHLTQFFTSRLTDW